MTRRPSDILSDLEDVSARTAALERRGFTEDWHTVGGAGEPAFQNSWVNHVAAGNGPAQFRRLPTGEVVMRGIIKDGTVLATIFTLPSTYYPPYTARFAIVSTNAFGFLSVDTAGIVILLAGTNTYISLDQVRFFAVGA